MNAIILCAGEGVRMRPVTNHIPKPLLPIVDRTLLDLHVQQLQQQGVSSIGINLYHKADMVQSYISKYYDDSIQVAVEPTLLGTGGALRNFPQFGQDEIVVTSCDALGEWNIPALADFHHSHKGYATLVLSNAGKDRTVEIDGNNHVVHIGTSRSKEGSYDFTGTAIYSKNILTCLPEKRTFSFIDLITHIQNQGKLVYGFTTEIGWYNINTCRALLKIHEDILCNHITVKGICADGSIFVDPSSIVETNTMDGFVVVGAHCTIGTGVELYNTIVVTGSTIVQGTYRNCIVSNDFCIQVNDKDV